MQKVEIEFLAGINYNTQLLFYIQYMTIFYMKIPCKALHWSGPEVKATCNLQVGHLLPTTGFQRSPGADQRNHGVHRRKPNLRF